MPDWSGPNSLQVINFHAANWKFHAAAGAGAGRLFVYRGRVGAVAQGRSPGRDRAPRRHCLLGRGHRGFAGAGDGRVRQRLFRLLHHAPQQPRPAHRLQVRGAVVGTGRLAAVLGVAAVNLRAGAAAALQSRSAIDGVRVGDHRRGAGVLPAAGEFRGAPLRPGQRTDSRRRQRAESAAAISRDGHPSADAVPRLRGRDRAVRLRAGRADHEVSRREVDPHHAPLDHGGVAVPHLRHLPGRALGLRSAGLGRLLGMGPGGERFPAAVADHDCVSAFGDDAGEARHDEDVEHVAHLHHVSAGDFRHVPHAQRRGEFGARVCAVGHRHLVRVVPGAERSPPACSSSCAIAKR